MPLRVRCPRCHQTADIPDGLLGRQGQCNNCGALVAIPARLTKVCVDCGTDVTGVQHKKDKESNYLCIPCFQRRSRSEQAQFALPKTECSICHVQFPAEQARRAQGQPICRDCSMILAREEAEDGKETIAFVAERPMPDEQSERRSPTPASATLARPAPAASFSAVAETQPTFEDLQQLEMVPVAESPASQRHSPVSFAAPRKESRLPLIVAMLALVGVVVIGTIQFSQPGNVAPAIDPEREAQKRLEREVAESELVTRLLVLKGQAEVLIDVGKLREGIQKYDTLLRLADGKTFQNANVTAEIANARLAREQALKTLAAAQPPIEEKAEAKPVEPAPAPAPAPASSPTIFDEK